MTAIEEDDLSTADIYSYVIIILAAIGVFVNVGSLVMLLRKRSCSMFHNLLKILAISDFLVVNGCALLYALPDLWFYYARIIYPVILPYLLPIVQISMMTSVYSTIVMSFERYVRIGHTCQLKACSYITDDNFRYYVIGIIICPMLFYLPKFFELKTVYSKIGFDYVVDCVSLLNPPKFNMSIQSGASSELSPETLLGTLSTPSAYEDLISSSHNNSTTSITTTTSSNNNNSSNQSSLLAQGLFSSGLSSGNSSSSMTRPSFSEAGEGLFWPFLNKCEEALRRNETKILHSTKYVQNINIESSQLSQNELYMQIYSFGLNTLFASVIPLVSLLYLNIYTVVALRRMGRENGVAVNSRVNNRREKLKDNSPNPTKLVGNKNPRIGLNPISSQKELSSVSGKDVSRSLVKTYQCEPANVSRSKRRFRSIRMRLVNETIELRTSVSETFFNRGRQPNGYRHHHKSTRAHLRLGRRLLGVETSKSFESGNSNLKLENVSSSQNGVGPGATRARSESQGEYSPKRRNDELLLRQTKGTMAKKRSTSRSRHRNNRQHKERFRRRANSAPEEIRTIHEETKTNSSGPDELSCDLVINIGEDDGQDVTTEFVFRNSHSGMLHPRPPHSLANLSRTTTSLIQDHNAAHRKCSLPCRNEGRSTLLRRGENRITRIALAIVWLFLFCHSWKLVPTFYELIYSSSENWPSWLMHVNDLSHSFIVFNSAVNFLLYTVL